MTRKKENENNEVKTIEGETTPPVETTAVNSVYQPVPEIQAMVPENSRSSVDDDPIDEKFEISRLLNEGYSVRQIIDLGFNRRTTYHYAKLRVKPENDPVSDTEAVTANSNGRVKHEMIKLGSKDVIPPEAVMEVLHLPQNGDAVEVWRRGVMDGVGILLLGARYSQLTAAGQAEIVKNQLDIMREAKSDSKEVARAAAEEAAWRVGQQIHDEVARQPVKSESPNPMASMLTGAIQPYFAQALAKMFGMFGGFSIPSGQPGQVLPGGEQSSNVPSGNNQISNEEMEAAFNDE